MAKRQRKPMTQEQRERWNAYMREYRRRNPDKVRRWRDAGTLRKAARLMAAQTGEGGAQHGD